MRRSLLLGLALLLIGSLAIVTSPGAVAGSGPGTTVGPVVADGSGAHGAGLGVTGALPLHAQALATAKLHADERALGNARLSGGTPVSTLGWSGATDPQVTPPDTTGAIGPNSYIELINLQYEIFNRSGSVISAGPIENITAGSHACLTDPQIIWDPDRQQFFYSILDTCNETFDLGFSKTANPTGGGASQWCQYSAFQYGSQLPDFPKLGDSRDFIFIGSNVFTNAIFTYIYDRSDVAWINKSDLSYNASTDTCNYSGIRAGVFTGVTDAFGALEAVARDLQHVARAPRDEQRKKIGDARERLELAIDVLVDRANFDDRTADFFRQRGYQPIVQQFLVGIRKDRNHRRRVLEVLEQDSDPATANAGKEDAARELRQTMRASNHCADDSRNASQAIERSNEGA